jgi:glycosyltransferase involved in cell wall biosynthesis
MVTIVVAALNEEQHIGACLEALAAQDYPTDRLEVVVADGGSTDRTRHVVEAVSARDRRVRLIDNPKRIAASGFNAGIVSGRGSVVGIMSAHAVPARDYLSRAVNALRTTGADAVGGRIVKLARSPRQRAIAAATSSPFGVGNSRHNYATRAQLAETVFPGMWPRTVLDRVGPFDEELVRNQDDELSYRIRRAGGRIWYDPAIQVAYVPRDSIRALFSQYRQYGFWRIRVLRKHPEALQVRQLAPPLWVASLLFGLAGAVTGTRLRLLLVPSLGGYLGLMVATLGRGQPAAQAALRVAAAGAMHLGYGIGMLDGACRLAVGMAVAARSRTEKP